MTRRAALPGADELFRTTTVRPQRQSTPVEAEVPSDEVRRPETGRRKHDTKITVYVSAEEVLGLEQARLTLRAEYGIAVDRGRVVREAVSVLLADLDERGADSVLVRRLRQEIGE